MRLPGWIARNVRPSRLFSPSRAKRSLHLLGVLLFQRLLRLTNSPVEFRIGQRCCIALSGVLLDYDTSHSGDVLSMDADGPWEPPDVAFVINHLRSGGVLYDIGANIGWYTLNVALKTPATTVCFEPQPERLLRNLKLNNVEAIVICVALGAEEGSVSMTTEHKAANFISELGSVRVPLATLDRLVEERMLSPPTLIKVDVEGFEYFVLRGAERTLREHRPIIMCEVNGLGEARFGVPERMLLEFMAKLGYQRQPTDCANWVFACATTTADA